MEGVEQDAVLVLAVDALGGNILGVNVLASSLSSCSPRYDDEDDDFLSPICEAPPSRGCPTLPFSSIDGIPSRGSSMRRLK